MQDILEAGTQQKINSFLSKKARQFPELQLRETWRGPDSKPRRYFVNGMKKYQLLKEV